MDNNTIQKIKNKILKENNSILKGELQFMVKNKNILSVSNLKKSYDDFLALNNINLSLNSGEYVVLLGPN